MKLKNKKTGEIGTLIVDGAYKFVTNFAIEDDKMNRLGEYNSLAELNKEWEDYEDPKEYWMITDLGELKSVRLDQHHQNIEKCKQIGNYFKTKEEAEKAAEKLKTWKRLKDKGFKFEYCEEVEGYDDAIRIMAYPGDCDMEDVIELFGGEK